MAQDLKKTIPSWTPLPGPQTQALETKADILFYGGAAGGGKTDLLLGCAFTKHHRAIIFRRVFPSLRAIIDRSRKIYNQYGTSAAKDSYNESLHRWKFEDGREIRFGSIQYDKNVTDYQGQPHDLYGFDEITEFSESMFRFVTGWNRTTIKGQRCRIICTGNPPTDPEGEWVIQFWGPWLDPNHPNPAAPGELRWFTSHGGKDIEVPDDRELIIKNDEFIYEFDREKIPPEEILKPISRTFIPARLTDNPYYMATGYMSRLQSLPEPMRSMMLYGSFEAGREDNPWQVIPTAWVVAAQERWKATPKPSIPLSCIGVDVARGGKDNSVYTLRHGNWFDRQILQAGKDTPDSDPVIAEIARLRGTSAAKCNIDVIGVGSAVVDGLKKVISPSAVMGIHNAESSDAKDQSGNLGFVNLRSEFMWKLREALDPKSGQNLCIPDDRELRVDLCSPRWKPTARGIQIELKDEIKKRIGRSPDKGDSLILAHAEKTISGQGFLNYYAEEATKAAKAKMDAEKHKP